jgi:hypothetical protein
MAIQEINYDIIQNDTWSVDITVKDSAGALINFTGYNFLMEVRDREGGSVLCATASLGSGITVTGTGVIHVELTPAQTNKFNLPKSKYQIISIDASSRRKTLVQGWFQVRPNTIL